MKLQLSEVLNLNQTLKLIIDDTTRKIDPLFKFRLLGIMKSIEGHIANFEIIRNEKINEYGTKAEDGSVSIPKDDLESIKKFNNDLMAVINSDVEINVSKLQAGEVFDHGVNAEYLVGLYPIMEE